MALNQGEVVVAFLSVTCSHCKTAAYKLAIAEKKYNMPRVVTVFIGKEEKLPKFWEESNSEFPYVFSYAFIAYTIQNIALPCETSLRNYCETSTKLLRNYYETTKFNLVLLSETTTKLLSAT